MEKKGKILKGKEIVFDPTPNRREDKNAIFRISPICGSCMNFVSLNLLSSDNIIQKKCTVFPDGIPEEIWSGINDHKTHFKGDKGGRYTEITSKPVLALLNSYIEAGGEKQDLARQIQHVLKGG